ncbi:MAG TPA: DUF418 domain-containing transporter [Nannocystaceae bacterium]|nr:DUF418 domain-containing transporter [Nannocystaceae bacterium]
MTAATSSGGRLALLDALRGLAVFAMIEQHVGIWLWRGPDPGMTRLDYPLLVAFNAGTAIFAPMFYALSGAGTALLCRRGDRPGLDGMLVRRGLLLYAFGVLVNLLTPSWFSWGSFFALHMMGVGIMLAPLWRRLSDRALLVVVAAIFAATPFIAAWLELPEDLTNPEMRDVTLPGGAFRLALSGSQYSLVPWLSTFVLGFWTGRAIARGAVREIVAVGTVVFATGAIGAALVWLTGASEPDLLWRAFRLKLGWFPPAISIITLLLGPTLWIIAWAVRREARTPLRSDHPLVTLGRISLTVFIIHAPLFRELSRPIGLWSALTPGPTLLAIAAFTIACLVLARWWARYDFRYGAEWLMRKLADRDQR